MAPGEVCFCYLKANVSISEGGVQRRAPGGPLPMGPSGAQPKRVTWAPALMGSPPAGGATGVGCSVSWVADKGRVSRGLILGCRS